MTKRLFQKKWVGISVICLSAGVVFGIMALMPSIRNMQKGTVQINLTKEQRRSFEDEVRKIKKEIQSQTEGVKKTEPRVMAVRYIQLARAYENLGQIAKSIGAYTDALKQDPKNADAFVGRADMKKELKEYGAAEEDYRSALDADTQNIDLYQKFADFYAYRMSDADKARGVYIEGLLRTNDSSELKRHFAVFLESTGSAYEAYLYWTALAQANSADAEAQVHANALRPSVQDAIRASEQAGKKSKKAK